jgi:stage II sporulation protein R
VKVEVIDMYFDDKVYDDLTMPAGNYDAVRITIGKAEGQNWWCVMFPPLCLPAVTVDNETVDVFNDVFSDTEQDILKNPMKYEAKFFFVELFYRIFGRG